MTEMSKMMREVDRVDASVISDLLDVGGEINIIDQLLTEQRTLTAVERFSQKHQDATAPIQSKYYQDLIPIRKPSTGEQYGFEVDLDKCTGCKACVVACHSLNGLKDNESWRDIGSIRGVVDGVAEQQTVTSACHHCLDPACLSGCPVGAYEKMPDTGIVRHLDDQCIGCQYCSLKCPYDVPKYDKELGIVRKCDMCHDRLAEGEAPPCVQSCPSGAISIQLINIEEKKAEAMLGGSIVAGAFRSDYTLPTTNFRTKRKLTSGMESADEMDLTPAHGHYPLVWMLMLTQVAVGISVVDGLGRLFAPSHFESLSQALTLIAVVLGNVGLGASLLHLGSPLGAWRVFLGL
jgi:formate dehydrogenase iron-sulfur subunit